MWSKSLVLFSLLNNIVCSWYSLQEHWDTLASVAAGILMAFVSITSVSLWDKSSNSNGDTNNKTLKWLENLCGPSQFCDNFGLLCMRVLVDLFWAFALLKKKKQGKQSSKKIKRQEHTMIS